VKIAISKLQKLEEEPYLLDLDLSDLKSIEKCVSELRKTKIKRIDVLINNAGVMATRTRQLTKQGLEMQMGVNYIGHFYLTNLLVILYFNIVSYPT
jgi:NAD(P)-dependent dehydrogenase (short-subunit alcohol dehydrogenase family)